MIRKFCLHRSDTRVDTETMIAFLCAAIALAFGVFRLYGSVMKMEREVG